MAISPAKLLILALTLASMLAVSTANRGWHYGWPFPHNKHNFTERSNTIVVGGSENWHYGFNYTDWALKTAPFYTNDKLVFKYDPPINETFRHSVYQFTDVWSYLSCDFTYAKMIADPTKGAGNGFEFKLKRWQPYYFACGEHDGMHCKDGMMKFFVMPMPTWWRK